jgi:quinol monooxygenase YgiN
MDTISQNNDLYTVIVRYTVEPENQAELVQVLQRSAPTFAQLPGFVSLNMHKGHDGKQVIVYLQWRSKADSDACMTNPVWWESGKELMDTLIQTGRATMDPQPFDIITTIEA